MQRNYPNHGPDFESKSDVERYSHEPLLERVWALRANVSAYDAVYLALAEALSTVLVAGDRRRLGAPGVNAAIEII